MQPPNAIIKRIVYFFDKVEDKVRAKLSHFPLLYAFLGGVGVVLFWRGVWHTTDFLTQMLLGLSGITIFGLVDGPLSLIVGTVLLLLTGVFVSAFIGSRLIITGLSGEKKLAEKTEAEIKTEANQMNKLQDTINKLEEDVESLESKIERK